MWVAPDHRGRGVAQRLIAEVAEWSVADGASVLRLDVGVDNGPARAAYLRAGFVPSGELLPPERDGAVVEEIFRMPLPATGRRAPGVQATPR
jgi:ribosomal protein S18 acetylase RimI-like enzyme